MNAPGRLQRVIAACRYPFGADERHTPEGVNSWLAQLSFRRLQIAAPREGEQEAPHRGPLSVPGLSDRKVSDPVRRLIWVKCGDDPPCNLRTANLVLGNERS